MLKFLIVDLGQDRIILGYPWFREFNPTIDWPKKFVKGPPFLAADATIVPSDLVTHAKTFTHRRYLNPNGRAFIQHMTNEYEDNESDLNENRDKSHTFITQFDPRPHNEAPIMPGAAERVQHELNRVERHLDLTKTTQIQCEDTLDYDKDFTETFKERQARKILATQFTPEPIKQTVGTQEQQLEKLMDSSPLAKVAQLKEENRQRRIQNQLDIMETSLTATEQPTLPTPPDTPPPKASEHLQALGQALEIN